MNANAPIGIGGMLITGVFRGWNGQRRAIVDIALDGLEEPMTVEVRSIAALGLGDIGADVLVQFTSDTKAAPIVMGRLDPGPADMASVEVDGYSQTLEITGDREITLRCGKASITLTRAGKIILRGTYISSRSSGVNRIKGGSVQLN